MDVPIGGGGLACFGICVRFRCAVKYNVVIVLGFGFGVDAGCVCMLIK